MDAFRMIESDRREGLTARRRRMFSRPADGPARAAVRRWLAAASLGVLCLPGVMLLPGCQSTGLFRSAHKEPATQADALFKELEQAKNARSSSQTRSPAGSPAATQEQMALGEQALSEHAQNPARLADARAHFEEVLRVDPGHAQAHHRLAVVADLAQDYPAAEQHYRQALAKDPGNPQLLHDVGYSYLLQGRPTEAIPYLQRSLQASPGFEMAARKLADAYVQTRQHQLADQTLRQILPEAQATAELDRLRRSHDPAAKPSLLSRVRQNLQDLRPETREPPDPTQQLLAELQTARQQGDQAKLDRQSQANRGPIPSGPYGQPGPSGQRGPYEAGGANAAPPDAYLANAIAQVDRESRPQPGTPIYLDPRASSGGAAAQNQMAGYAPAGGSPWPNAGMPVAGGNVPPAYNPAAGYGAPQSPVGPMAGGQVPVFAGANSPPTYPSGWPGGAPGPGNGPAATGPVITANGVAGNGPAANAAGGPGAVGQPGMPPVMGSPVQAAAYEQRPWTENGGTAGAPTGGPSFQYAEIVRGTERGTAQPWPTRHWRDQAAAVQAAQSAGPQGNGRPGTPQDMADRGAPGQGVASAMYSQYGESQFNGYQPAGTPPPGQALNQPTNPANNYVYIGERGVTATGGQWAAGNAVPTADPASAADDYKAAAALGMGVGPGPMFPVLRQAERAWPGTSSHWNGSQFPAPHRQLPTDRAPADLRMSASMPGPQQTSDAPLTPPPNNYGQQMPAPAQYWTSPQQYSTAPAGGWSTESAYQAQPPLSTPGANPLQSYDRLRAEYDARYNANIQQMYAPAQAANLPQPANSLPVVPATPPGDQLNNWYLPATGGTNANQSAAQTGGQDYGSGPVVPTAYPSAQYQQPASPTAPQVAPRSQGSTLPPAAYSQGVQVPQPYQPAGAGWPQVGGVPGQQPPAYPYANGSGAAAAGYPGPVIRPAQ